MNISGWKKQEDDIRDIQTRRHTLAADLLPSKFTLPIQTKIYDQGYIGSCVANSACSAFLYEAIQEKSNTAYDPSRMFLYYNIRKMHGWENEDSGAFIRDAFKSMRNEGICYENRCKYNIKKFTKTPSKTAYREGLRHRTLKYAYVPRDIDNIKRVLVSGACISFGFYVYESFVYSGNWDRDHGVMPIPGKDEGVVGGHAVTCIGYDDERQLLKIQNSWGIGWGQRGIFYIPYSFATSTDCSDFWCIEELL